MMVTKYTKNLTRCASSHNLVDITLTTSISWLKRYYLWFDKVSWNKEINKKNMKSERIKKVSIRLFCTRKSTKDWLWEGYYQCFFERGGRALFECLHCNSFTQQTKIPPPPHMYSNTKTNGCMGYFLTLNQVHSRLPSVDSLTGRQTTWYREASQNCRTVFWLS